MHRVRRQIDSIDQYPAKPVVLEIVIGLNAKPASDSRTPAISADKQRSAQLLALPAFRLDLDNPISSRVLRDRARGGRSQDRRACLFGGFDRRLLEPWVRDAKLGQRIFRVIVPTGLFQRRAFEIRLPEVKRIRPS